MHLVIKFIDGTGQKEDCESFSVTKDTRLLSIYKGGNRHSIYINMDSIKSFQEENQNEKRQI